MIDVEFTQVDEEIKDFSPTRRRQYWSRVSQWAEEGRRSAEALLQYGHKGLRVVVDSEWELAITCDDCNLWASMTSKLPKMKLSYVSAGGTLLTVVDCSPTAVRDHFKDKVTPIEPWVGHDGSQIEYPHITSRDGEYLYHSSRPSRKGGYEYRKEREARDAAAAEEQGS